jgi:hypothetical protein
MLFVGSGASVDFGLPLMNKFFADFFSGADYNIEEKLQTGSFEADAKDEEFIAVLLYFLYKDEKTMNLERLLEHAQNRLDILQAVKGNNSPELIDAFNFLLASESGFKATDTIGKEKIFTGDFIKKYVKKFEDAIKTISISLYKVYDKNLSGKREAIKNRYHPIFSMLNGCNEHNIAVFTTNYDRVLDVYLENWCEKLDRHLITCFEPISRKNHDLFMLGKKLSSKMVAGLRNYHGPPSKPKLSYFNLHGSVAWLPRDKNIFYVKKGVAHRDYSKDEIPLAVPVVSKGDNKPAICKVMYQFFFDYLASTNLQKIVSIGFSFNDEEITQKVAESISERGVKLIIVNPDFDSTQHAILSMVPKEKIHIIKYKVGDDEVLPKLQMALR